jgi:acetate kinase
VNVLVVNAGSSTVKLALLAGDDQTLAERELETPQTEIDVDSLRAALAEGLARADVVGHRIVHGGERFSEAVGVDQAVQDALEALVDLAPLHQPRSIAALAAVSEALPDVPAVACFDTAFHRSMSDAAATYALPAEWRERWHVRRYGFHGLSHGWIARRAPQLLGVSAAGLRLVSCHIGAGASLCAILDGHSVDTTMGFTPLEGLVMATRSGSVDPGMMLWLLERTAMTEHELAHALEHESGLYALAGTADMRQVLASAGGGDPNARLALAVYLHRLRGGIAAMAAALDGVDAVAFTGGIGQRSVEIRADAVAGLGFLGLEIDEQLNANGQGDREITAAGAPVRTLVIEAREDLEIARQARAVVRAAA